jgi:DNA-binding CsgD family transcriptional regulator
MEHWTDVSANTGMAVDCADVCRLFESIGRGDPAALASAILQLVGRHVAVADCTVMAFAHDREPRLVSAASLANTPQTLQIAASRMRSLAHLERIQLHLRSLLPLQIVGSVTLHRQTTKQIIDSELQRLYRRTLDTVDCVAITLKSGCREWISVNLCRHRSQGLLGEAEIETLLRLAPLIASCLSQQKRFAREDDNEGGFSVSQSDGIEELCSRLTTRERQVIRRILDGATVERIAADLGLKPTTVITYRSRGYEKLGVSSRHELFAAVLQRRNDINRLSVSDVHRHTVVSGNRYIAPAA